MAKEHRKNLICKQKKIINNHTYKQTQPIQLTKRSFQRIDQPYKIPIQLHLEPVIQKKAITAIILQFQLDGDISWDRLTWFCLHPAAPRLKIAKVASGNQSSRGNTANVANIANECMAKRTCVSIKCKKRQNI